MEKKSSPHFIESFGDYSTLCLRIGLAGVLLWFGSHEVFDPASWMGYAPDWATHLGFISVQNLIIFNGIIELILGLCILFGFFTRVAAALMIVHFIPIIASLGYNEIAVRDVGLWFSALALFFAPEDWCRVDCYLKKKR